MNQQVKPLTDFVIVRRSRNPIEGSDMGFTGVEVIKNNENLDLTGFSFLKMSTATPEYPMEEWVPTVELEAHKKVYNISE